MLTPEDIQAISNLINNAIQPLRDDISDLIKDVNDLKKDVNDLIKEVKELKGAFGKLTDRVVSIEKFIKI
jgi:regulator of replication initiation timing